ncbi:hypothetical protein Y1Q_0001769 [Alligator mississippiensis]|uniref:Uncharacterized protein n=1 Tax=Alligator mississippiensis TaxID=8496 RepID=A0A151MKT9_ALLMI|nr:hypothetical protein Y1Q_0001769 [Alligator mississippiensis]
MAPALRTSTSILWAQRKISGNGKLPPGPIVFRIIGNMLQLNTKNLPQFLYKGLFSAMGSHGSSSVLVNKPYINRHLLLSEEPIDPNQIKKCQAESSRGTKVKNDSKQSMEWPFDPTFFLTHAVSNIICSTVFGNWFDYEDKKFLTLIRLIEENENLFRSPVGKYITRVNCASATFLKLRQCVFKNKALQK